ncbi:MAG: copper resistance protein B, partial [Stenotrophomonas sp.]
ADPHAGHNMSADPHAGHNMSADPHAGHAPGTALTTPRTPIPVPTAADIAAAFPVLQAHSMEHAPGVNRYLLVDQLEAWDNAKGSGQAWALQGWWGTDTQRLWLRAEGEREGGSSDGSIDLLYGQATGPWWDAVAGVRHEHGPQPRTRAAFGVQGLSPYRLETQATVLVGGDPRAELEVELEYSMLLTNRLILQPSVEASALLRDDRGHGLGRGLASVEGGLRLRYEINRRFAPYVGVVHERRFGRSADFAAADGHDRQHTRWVAGIRMWF